MSLLDRAESAILDKLMSSQSARDGIGRVVQLMQDDANYKARINDNMAAFIGEIQAQRHAIENQTQVLVAVHRQQQELFAEIKRLSATTAQPTGVHNARPNGHDKPANDLDAGG